ncbi:MAG: radical SAM protein, partial [Planctomycetota bacterium]
MPSTPEQPIRITLRGQSAGPSSADAILRATESGGGEGGNRSGGGRDAVLSMYVHVPFCFHKCHYCDFYSFVDTNDRQGDFVDALILELNAIADSEERAGHTPALDTLFVGGGTPTLLALDQWERLGGALRGRFAITDRTEWTVECNPETATPELMALLAGIGVNRLSVGAQTFHPDHLRTLERWHEPRNVEKALDLARD